jgi:hypothetical protein
MKKFIILLMTFVAVFGIEAKPQNIPLYPIPSYNVEVTGYAKFQQSTQSTSQYQVQPQDKQDVNVEVSTPSGVTNCQATVWVYCLNSNTVLGPYTVYCNEPLQVDVDPSQLWGVLIDTDEDLLISVWIN